MPIPVDLGISNMDAVDEGFLAGGEEEGLSPVVLAVEESDEARQPGQNGAGVFDEGGEEVVGRGDPGGAVISDDVPADFDAVAAFREGGRIAAAGFENFWGWGLFRGETGRGDIAGFGEARKTFEGFATEGNVAGDAGVGLIDYFGLRVVLDGGGEVEDWLDVGGTSVEEARFDAVDGYWGDFSERLELSNDGAVDLPRWARCDSRSSELGWMPEVGERLEVAVGSDAKNRLACITSDREVGPCLRDVD